MSFRTTQRDDRRRRMMTAGAEPATAGAAVPRHSLPQAATSKHVVAESESRGYATSALRDDQPHAMDFVPLRGWKVALAFSAIIAAATTLATLHTWLPEKLSVDLAGTALDLTSAVGLQTWFSATMLLAAATLATIVYSIRAHKLDDYRGRYRVWRQAAVGWLVLSIAVGSNLCATIETVTSSVMGGNLAGNVALWWALPAAAMVGYIVPALVADLSRCCLGTVALVIGVLTWAFGTASELGWLPLDAAEQPRIEAIALLAGHCLLLMSMTLYARFVIRESQGLISPRLKRAKQVPADSQTVHPASNVKADVKEPKPVKKKLVANHAPAAIDEDAEPAKSRRFFGFGRSKTARIEPAHISADETVPEPHISARKVAKQAPPSANERRIDKPAPKPTATAVKPKSKSKQAAATHDDPIAEEIARLEGLGGRLSKSQRKKLRKLRRQVGQDE